MKINGQEIMFEQAIQNAINAYACLAEITEIKKYSSFEELLKSERAPYWLYWYARDVIKGRWPEAESVIARDAHWAGWYAHSVLESDGL